MKYAYVCTSAINIKIFVYGMEKFKTADQIPFLFRFQESQKYFWTIL
jgi:hypothetical protein